MYVFYIVTEVQIDISRRVRVSMFSSRHTDFSYVQPPVIHEFRDDAEEIHWSFKLTRNGAT